MSSTLTPYLVDLEELRRAVGSKDESLLSAVIQGNEEDFGREDDDEDEIPLGRALRHLVMGEPPDTGSAHQYGYALMRLCDHLGTTTSSLDLWSGVQWDCVESTGLDEVFDRSGPPVPLPPSDDFPTIGFLTAEEIASTVSKLGDGHVTTAGSSTRGWKPPGIKKLLRNLLLSILRRAFSQREKLRDEDVRELLDEYEGWLREAAANNKALVFFYY